MSERPIDRTIDELRPGEVILAPEPHVGDDGITITGVEIVSNQRAGEGGFFAIRRMRLCNVRADGSRSAEMLLDFMERPKGLDAVAVAVWTRDPDGRVRVMLRSGLRPTILFGRPRASQPIPDPSPRLFIKEVVAGIVEVGEHGEAALRQRAADEVHEESGFVVDPARVELLGNGILLSPGALAEKCHLAAVEVDPSSRGHIGGDGSAMEEASRLEWRPLGDAIRACVHGDLDDAKTEVALRRLADHLRT